MPWHHVYLYGEDKSKAENELLHALELNPRHVQARIWYGLYYLQWVAGRLEEGLQQVKQAAECDPLSGYAYAMLAASCIAAGKFDEATHAANSALDMDPEVFTARWLLFSAQHQLGQFEEAVANGESALALSGRHPWIVGELALTFADWGKPAEAEALYMELVWRAKREYVQLIALAFAASAVNDEEAAFRYAHEAYRRRDPGMIAAKRMPMCARLHKDPRFQEILVAMGLK